MSAHQGRCPEGGVLDDGSCAGVCTGCGRHLATILNDGTKPFCPGCQRPDEPGSADVDDDGIPVL